MLRSSLSLQGEPVSSVWGQKQQPWCVHYHTLLDASTQNLLIVCLVLPTVNQEFSFCSTYQINQWRCTHTHKGFWTWNRNSFKLNHLFSSPEQGSLPIGADSHQDRSACLTLWCGIVNGGRLKGQGPRVPWLLALHLHLTDWCPFLESKVRICIELATLDLLKFWKPETVSLKYLEINIFFYVCEMIGVVLIEA